MKTRINSRTIRNTLIAITAMTLPLMASASPNISVSFVKSDLESSQGQQRIYQQMKTASRDLCGDTSLNLTGSLAASRANESCYEGTLTAAVKRLDNEAISELHTAL
jgi:UrcA family protein